MTQGAKVYNTNRSGIKKCCDGTATYSGIYEGKELRWIYYKDYLESIASKESGAFCME